MTKNRRFACLPIAIVASALSASVAFADGAPEKKGECSVDQFTMALRYQQQSAEVRALQMQAYNIATEKLDAAVAGAQDPSKLAIVSDVDETIIDNSALLARDLANCHTYDGWDTWLPWERDGNPVLIPGAKKFLEHADKLGVTIRYVSDRSQEQKDYTLKALKKLDLPQVSAESVLLLGPPKVERRALVTKDYRIVMLLGDTLHDFDARFRKTPVSEQRATAEAESAKWGTEWIVFPNSGYGTWSKEPLKGWDAKPVIEKW